MRKVRNGKVDLRVMRVISENYQKLHELCNAGNYGLYCSKSYDDMFQDTILYMIHDKVAARMRTDKEIISLFLFRYKMIKFQTIHDDRILKESAYGEHKQTEKEETEE